MIQLKIGTLNVNGLANHKKRTDIFKYLKQTDADFFCIQETHSTYELTDKWTKEWGGQAFWSHGTYKSRGTAILIKNNTDATITDIKTDQDGRIISVVVNMENLEINLISVYAPTDKTARRKFYNTLQQYPTPTQYTVIGGDFNCIEDPTKDKTGGNPALGYAGTTQLLTWTNSLQTKDTWRNEHPTSREYTWHNVDYSIRTRIDRIYSNKELTQNSRTKIIACPYSDHSLVLTKIKTPKENPRGGGNWKMNTSILKDKLFDNEMKHFLNYWPHEKNNYPDSATWWDEMKNKIKGITIRHSKRISKKRKSQTERLTKELHELQQKTMTSKTQINLKERELKQQLDRENEGTKIRSRAKWMEEGEKPTKFFYGLEKARQKKNTIGELKKENGEIITTDIEILEEARAFYQKLYTADENTDTNDQKWLLNNLEKTLNEIDKDRCEGPMLTKEITKAVENMQTNKSPGPDGIPLEFYKHYWQHLKEHLIQLFNENYDQEIMSESQRKALLKLLYKKKDKLLLKNWRPISLLNTDYKIAAKVIANRMKEVLPEIVHPDQTCGITNRTIFENLFILRDIIYQTNTNNNDVTLISLDQEKAFDRVDRTFLYKTLKQLNFGPSLIHWIATLYKDANCTVMNNGWMSDEIQLHRGLRQGCPLSPLLYVLIVESLGEALRKDDGVRGVPIPGGHGLTQKLTQYADDTTLMLQDDNSVQRAFDIITRYERGTGSKLNYEKTKGIYIGRRQGQTHGAVPITWTNDPIDVLGTKISPSLQQDWQKQTNKLDQRLQGWSSRSLTIYGRALITRTFGLANFIFLATIFVIPQNVITNVQKSIFGFIWKGKTELIKRTSLNQSFKKGGLLIPNLTTANATTKTKWIKEIGDENYTHPWVYWARYYIGTALSTVKHQWSFLRTHLKPHADPNNIPEWYALVQRTIKENSPVLSQLEQKNITNKNLTDIIENATAEEPRAIKKWAEEHRIKKENIESLWEELWKRWNKNEAKEIMWKASHKVLPTKKYIRSWNKDITTNDRCPFCRKSESIEHALVKCERLTNLWKYVKDLLTKINGQTNLITMTNMIFNESQRNREEEILIKYIITLSISLIWETRNKMLGKKEQPPPLIDEMKKRIRERINIDKINKKYTNLNIWAYKNILIHVTDDYEIIYII